MVKPLLYTNLEMFFKPNLVYKWENPNLISINSLCSDPAVTLDHIKLKLMELDLEFDLELDSQVPRPPVFQKGMKMFFFFVLKDIFYIFLFIFIYFY